MGFVLTGVKTASGSPCFDSKYPISSFFLRAAAAGGSRVWRDFALCFRLTTVTFYSCILERQGGHDLLDVTSIFLHHLLCRNHGLEASGQS